MNQHKNQLKLKILAFFFSSFVHGNQTEVWGGERSFIELVKRLKGKATFDIFEKKPSVIKTKIIGGSVKVFEVTGVIQTILHVLNLRFRQLCNCDVIYAYNNAFTNVISALVASKVFDKPFIINVYHVEKYQMNNFKEGYHTARVFYGFNIRNALSVNLIWPIIRRILIHANAITVPSKATSTDLNSLGIKQEKIFVISLGLDHEKVDHRPVKMPSKDIDGIYIGRISINKGIFDALHSWKILVKEMPSAKIAIIGGKGESHLEDFINKNKLNDNVILFERLSEYELTEVLFRSKLLLMPSHTEGFCFAIGKAMLHDVPVVSYDIPVLREVYGSFPLITFVKEGDIESLALEVKDILSTKVSSALMKDKNSVQSKILQTYSWNRAGDNLYRILRNIR